MSGWSFECDERHCTTSVLLLVLFAFFYCVVLPANVHACTKHRRKKSHRARPDDASTPSL